MHRVLIALGLVVVAVAALVQVTSMAFYGDLAVAGSLPSHLPPGAGLALAQAAHLETGPAPVRAALAGALIHRGRLDAAARIVANLPPGTGSAELRGRLAEARGDGSAALDGFIAAGDVEHAQTLVDRLERTGALPAAIAAQDHLIAALGDGSGHTEVLAIALWRRGQLEEDAAVHGARPRGAHERAALAFYDRALALAPRDETFLLAAGRQALVLGDRAGAHTYYQRALDAVPNSVDARDGLAQSGPAS